MPAKQTTDPYAQYAQVPATPSDPYAQYAQPDQSASIPAEPASPSLFSQGMGIAKNLGIGAMKGAGSTMSAADDFARKHLPAFMTNTGMGFGPPENIPAVKSMMEPQGTAQTIGKGLEQAGEFMIPGGAEKKLLGKAPLLARAAGSVLTSGVVNKAQGGDFSTGALMGGGGNLIGEAARGLAPKIAESALDIRKASRAFGKTPGQAILEETRGVRPETIAASAQERMNQLTPQLESAVLASPAKASLLPARGVVDSAANTAAAQNAEGLFGQLGKQRDFLSYGGPSGDVTPRKLLDLKRGFNEEHLRWNPEMHDRALSTGRRAYGALDSELDRTVPEAAGLNQRISSLIPVAQGAESISRNAPIAQRLVGRAAAHTGALTLGGLGAGQGYREGGVPGAIAGGLTGLVAPELIATPEGQMIAARTLFSPATRTAGRAVGGGLLQLNRGGQQ